MLTGPAAQVLAVEDDLIVREILCAYLRAEGFEVGEAETARDGLERIRIAMPDLLIVDLDLPDLSGFEFVERARRLGDPAIIYVTASRTPEDRIRGLEGGGDDYLVKPVEARELLARVRSVLRRYRRGSGPPQPRQAVMELGGWTLDLVRRELADSGGRVVPLTRAEFDLLAALAQTATIALSREYLLEVVASAQATSNPRMIDVMVSKVRHKLAQAMQPAPRIETVKGLGYRFQAPGT